MIDFILSLLYYALFLFTPLIMTSITSELFEFNKMLSIYIITVCIAFMWIMKMIIQKRIIFRFTPLDIPILFFFSAQVLSTLFSIDRHTSIFGYYGRFNGGLLSILSYLILYFGFTSNFSVKEKAKQIIDGLLKTSLVSSVLVIGWGLPGRLGFDLSCFVFMGQFNNSCWTDQFHPELRMFSTLGQPNWLGAYLAIHFFIAVYFLLRNKWSEKKPAHELKKGYVTLSKKSKPLISYKNILITAYLILNFTSILFTRSRSALVSVLFGAFVLFIVLILMARKSKNPLGMLKYAGLWIIVFIIPIVIFKTDIAFVDRFLAFDMKPAPKKSVIPTQLSVQKQPPGYKINITDSIDIRKIVWQGAWDLGNRYPFFGTGPETFAYSYYFVRPLSHNLTSEWDYLYNKAHNEYLNYFATTGYVGIISYLIMISAVLIFGLIYLVKGTELMKKSFILLGLMSYLSILVTNFFGFSTTTINLFFYLLPALFIVTVRTTNEDKKIFSSSLSIRQWSLIGIDGVAAGFLIIFVIRYFFADTNYAMADSYFKRGDYQSAATFLTQALNLKYEHVYEDKLSYTYANLAVIASYQKEQEAAQKIISLANSYNEKSIKASPNNVLYWKTKAKNEYLIYQITLQKNAINEGVQALQKAFLLSPTDPKVPYSLSIFYSLLFDEEKNEDIKNNDKKASLESIDKAIALKPDYRDSYLLKGQLLKKYGDKENAKKTFEYILEHINNDDADVKKEIQSI